VALLASGELQHTNTGLWLPVISTGNVITPVTGDGTTGKILYAPSEADDPAYRAAISAGAGGAVVDYFDALTSERPYHKAMTSEEAMGLLRQESGKALDPRVVQTFAALYPALAAEAADVTFVAVDVDGRIDADALRAALRPDTVLVTLALAALASACNPSRPRNRARRRAWLTPRSAASSRCRAGRVLPASPNSRNRGAVAVDTHLSCAPPPRRSRAV